MGWGPWWLGLTKDFLFWCGLSCFSSVSLSITPVAMALHPPGAASRRKHLPCCVLSCLQCFTLPVHHLGKISPSPPGKANFKAAGTLAFLALIRRGFCKAAGGS